MFWVDLVPRGPRGGLLTTAITLGPVLSAMKTSDQRPICRSFGNRRTRHRKIFHLTGRVERKSPAGAGVESEIGNRRNGVIPIPRDPSEPHR